MFRKMLKYLVTFWAGGAIALYAIFSSVATAGARELGAADFWMLVTWPYYHLVNFWLG